MSSYVRKLIGSLIRYILMTVGATNITDGHIESLVSALLVIVAVIWEIIHQKKDDNKIKGIDPLDSKDLK